MAPSTTPWHEVWQDVATSSLSLRISLRKPGDVESLVRAWMGDFQDVTRSFLVDDGPAPYAKYVRIGSRELGNGEWSSEGTTENRERAVASYRAYSGGVCGWYLGDPRTDADCALGLARASLMTDDPSQATGTAHAVFIDLKRAGIPEAMETAWVTFLDDLVRNFDVLYAEISPRPDAHKALTNYEVRTGRRPNYRVKYLEIEERLRGCGWITWVPIHFTTLLKPEALHASGAFHRIEEIAGRGILLQMTDRAHEFDEARERQLERILGPLLEPNLP